MKDVIVMMEQTSEAEIRDLDKQLPTDLHLIEYTLDGEFCADGVRAHTMVDIFDFYHDLGFLNIKLPNESQQRILVGVVLNTNHIKKQK